MIYKSSRAAQTGQEIPNIGLSSKFHNIIIYCSLRRSKRKESEHNIFQKHKCCSNSSFFHAVPQMPRFRAIAILQDYCCVLLSLNKGCLLVNKRRGKEQDQTGKGDNSKEREEVSAKVLNVGCNHVGCGNLGGKISHGVFHKVQLWCVPCGECRAGCGSYPVKDQYIGGLEREREENQRQCEWEVHIRNVQARKYSNSSIKNDAKDRYSATMTLYTQPFQNYINPDFFLQSNRLTHQQHCWQGQRRPKRRRCKEQGWQEDGTWLRM